MQEMQVQSLSPENILGREMATHSSILAWDMARREEPDRPQSMGRIKVGLNPATTNRNISKDHTQVCVCVCVCVCGRCLSICISLSQSWSWSQKLRVFLPLSFWKPSRPSFPLAPACHRCYGSGWGACAGRLSPFAWVHVSVCVSVRVPA